MICRGLGVSLESYFLTEVQAAGNLFIYLFIVYSIKTRLKLHAFLSAGFLSQTMSPWMNGGLAMLRFRTSWELHDWSHHQKHCCESTHLVAEYPLRIVGYGPHIALWHPRQTVLKIQLHSVQLTKIFWCNNTVYFAFSVTELCLVCWNDTGLKNLLQVIFVHCSESSRCRNFTL